VPGTTVKFLLLLTCEQEGGLADSCVVVRSPQGRVKVKGRHEGDQLGGPVFEHQTFGEDQAVSYEGTITLPAKLDWGAFAVEVTVQDELRKNVTLYRKTFSFDLGAQRTAVRVEPSLVPDLDYKKWQFDVSAIVARTKQAVTGGIIRAAFDMQDVGEDLELSAERIDLAEDKGRIFWEPPETFAGQALIRFEYLGDTEADKQKDKVYLPSWTNTVVPPKLGERTQIVVQRKHEGKADENRYKLTVTVVQPDKNGAAINEGKLDILYDAGQLFCETLEHRTGLTAVKGEPIILEWEGTEQQAGSLQLHYMGDQERLDRLDGKFAESWEFVDLPPEGLHTTRLDLKSKAPEKGAGERCQITVEILDDRDYPVPEGNLEITGPTKKLSGLGSDGRNIPVDGEPIELTWKGGKGTLVFRYLGDQENPAIEDTRYAESTAKIVLPVKAQTSSGEPPQRNYKFSGKFRSPAILGDNRVEISLQLDDEEPELDWLHGYYKFDTNKHIWSEDGSSLEGLLDGRFQRSGLRMGSMQGKAEYDGWIRQKPAKGKGTWKASLNANGMVVGEIKVPGMPFPLKFTAKKVN
jgi:hypothetical protein